MVETAQESKAEGRPAYHALEVDACLQALEVERGGLSSEEAARRLEEYGPNKIQQEEGSPALKIFLAQFSDLLILLLLGATAISLVLGEYLDAGAMFSIVLLSAVMGFVQEYRAEKALEALRKLAAPKAKARRDGEWEMLDAVRLVPGDVVQLEAGDMVPADGRLLRAEQVSVDEASLTGESLAVGKSTGPVAEDTLLSDQANMVFLGTSVVKGVGEAVIVGTGSNTALGRIAQSIEDTEEQRTPLQNHLSRIAKQIAYVVLASVVVVFVVTLWQKPEAQTWASHAAGMLVFSLSLAVAAVPSSLPAIVTIGLSIGTKALARKNMIVKRLPAAEALGSVTVICSDKTGTLTKNQMTVTRVVTAAGLVEVSGAGYKPEGSFTREGEEVPIEPLEPLLRTGFLCNNAEVSQREGSYKVMGDPTEGALRVLARKAFSGKPFADFVRQREFPFDSSRKRMSVIGSSPGGELVAYVKGAPDELLERCSHVWKDGESVPLGEEEKASFLQSNEELASQALRVLGFAIRPVDTVEWDDADDLERSLTFVGLAGMLDPARDEVKEAIHLTREAGIRTVIITGDHALTARAIAEQIDLFREGDEVLTGQELHTLSDAALRDRLDALRIVARALPEHKLRIVTLLQEQGHIVAMTGDGVNDAPALKKADIGLAMGITGTDVAKSVSKAILVDDNYATIVLAIEEGRGIYDKIIKSTRYLLSCNAGEIVVVLLAVMTQLPLPMIPLQLLLMNLVTDGLPALALAVEPISHDAMRRPPRRPKANPLQPQILLMIGVFGLIMGTGAWFLFRMYVGNNLDHARTIAFTALVVLEMFAVFGSRSLRPFHRLNPFTNLWLLFAVMGSLGLQLLVIYWPPLQAVFQTVPLQWSEWAWILGLGLFGFLLMELSKFLEVLNPFSSSASSRKPAT